ncbi:AaceriAAR048Wp [[Ashbya] aceris (nom. inval.)]|nr:AaceriAAR048Wp [[Ashbya] aceris (nom. inval.)]
MKLQSTLYNVGYPVYGARFLNPNTLLVTGGGGEGNHGIPNKLTALQVNFNKKKIVKRFRELTLDENDDSPTTLDVAQDVILMGCNENSEKIRQGAPNHHLRKFVYENEHLKFVGAIDLNRSDNPEDYTKLLYMSQDGWVAAVASSAVPTIIRIVNPNNLRETYEVETGNDVKDLHFSSDGKVLAYITSSTLEVISIVTGNFIVRKTDFDKNFSLSKIRFIGEDTVLIAAALKKGTGIVLTKLSLKKGNTQILKTCVITKKFKSVTSMDVDPKGQLAVLAGSDNSLALVKLRNFSVAKFFKQVHTFAVTRVVFSPDSRLLVSVSAANTVHVVQLPEDFATRTTLTENLVKFLTNFVLIVLVALFARFAHQYDLHTKAYHVVSNTLRKREHRPTSFFNDILNQQITLIGDVVSSSTTAVDTAHSSVDTSGWYLESTSSYSDTAAALSGGLDGDAATIESLAKSAGVDSPVEVETLPHATSTTFSEVTAYTGAYPEVVSSAPSEVTIESNVDSKSTAIETSTTQAITISTSLQSISVSDVYTGTSVAEDISSRGSDASVVLGEAATTSPSPVIIAEEKFVNPTAEFPSASTTSSTPSVPSVAPSPFSLGAEKLSEPKITEGYKPAIESPSVSGQDDGSVILASSVAMHISVSSVSQTLTDQRQPIPSSLQTQNEDEIVKQGEDELVKQGEDELVKQGEDGIVKQGEDGIVKQGEDGIVKQGEDGIVKQGEDEIEESSQLESASTSSDHGDDILEHLDNGGEDKTVLDNSVEIGEYLDEILVKNFTSEIGNSLNEAHEGGDIAIGESEQIPTLDLELPELAGKHLDTRSDDQHLLENNTEAVLQIAPVFDGIELDDNMIDAEYSQSLSDPLQNIAIMPDVIDNLEIQTFSKQQEQQLEPSTSESVGASHNVHTEATMVEVQVFNPISSTENVASAESEDPINLKKLKAEMAIVDQASETVYNNAASDAPGSEDAVTSPEQLDSALDSTGGTNNSKMGADMQTELLAKNVGLQPTVAISEELNVPKTPVLEIIDEPQTVTEVHTVRETVVDGSTRSANTFMGNSTIEVITVKEIVKETVFVTEKVTN